ncbi:MAG TPA: 50S ribosomal protein L30 [Thermoanaerobaculia bacterium]|nr:50S ribosomal protein L30 [Thermoanaerobaculia bacterium]
MAAKAAKTEKKKTKGKTIRIRQVRSAIGTVRTHREVLRGLGLRRIRHEVVREDTPAVRGAVKKIEYLLEIVEEPS